MKRALITGVTGQDGSLLAEYLLSKGYEVFGLSRQANQSGLSAMNLLGGQVSLLHGEITEPNDVKNALLEARPSEVYHLASQSRPDQSWGRAPETLVANGLATIHLFDAIRSFFPECRVYNASSSEMYGQTLATPQNELTAFNPVNPYAAAKVYAHQMAKIYRDSYGLKISNGILFNHESERRPLHYVTQKVAYGAACAALGILVSPDANEMGRPIVQDGRLALGNLDVARDWGYARDFVRAMWLILQHPQADDFVIGTGNLHTLKQLCEVAYGCVGKDWRESVFSDPALVRPLESGQTLADPSKAMKTLNWQPTVNFEEMIQIMVSAQVERLERIAKLQN